MLILLQQNLGFAWGSVAQVSVPNVVGETQAQATSDISGAGLSASVSTAYSNAVAAGLVISQSPAAGTLVAPGSTVSIVVSLGDQPQAQASGGWESYFRYEQETLKRKRELQKQLEEEEARIQDEIDREIAQLLHQQDRQAQEKSDLARLQTLVNQYASQIESDVNAERVTNALKAAQARMTLASFERLAREINRAQEEEEFMFFLALIAEL